MPAPSIHPSILTDGLVQVEIHRRRSFIPALPPTCDIHNPPSTTQDRFPSPTPSSLQQNPSRPHQLAFYSGGSGILQPFLGPRILTLTARFTTPLLRLGADAHTRPATQWPVWAGTTATVAWRLPQHPMLEVILLLPLLTVRPRLRRGARHPRVSHLNSSSLNHPNIERDYQCVSKSSRTTPPTQS